MCVFFPQFAVRNIVKDEKNLKMIISLLLKINAPLKLNHVKVKLNWTKNWNLKITNI